MPSALDAWPDVAGADGTSGNRGQIYARVPGVNS